MTGTFRNPVHPEVLADPFVLKWNGAYYAYGTPEHGAALPVLRSTDLVTWEQAGEAIGRPPTGLAHWAPEVAYDNGRFFVYYSTGGFEGEGHQVRVAAGDSPTGPFDEDLGVLDPEDAFTIDAHPFLDDDGQWYLFYSRDFLEGEPVGTGVVVDRLLGMTRLAGEPRIVLRPHAEWHLFERQRRWYDRVWDWYTVEGPFVRKHGGRYWCFYSGGAWKAENYGMSAVVADHPLGPFRSAGSAGAAGPADAADVLRTVPG
ncbi:MAG: glycoside hydrolase family 43 protein, partial [Actinomycetota bacterium]|nr:glycoside hydrolase family 43 protein [Actinomycetota bacterium]